MLSFVQGISFLYRTLFCNESSLHFINAMWDESEWVECLHSCLLFDPLACSLVEWCRVGNGLGRLDVSHGGDELS